MEGELLWTLDNDVFASWVPADHVVIFGALEETVNERVRRGSAVLGRGDVRVEFCEKGGLGLCL